MIGYATQYLVNYITDKPSKLPDPAGALSKTGTID